MDLRRALLLFAIVLGLAALVASASRPRDDPGRSPPAQAPPERQPTATPAPARAETARLAFGPGEDEAQRLRVGRPAVVAVESEEAGQVEIPELGLSAPADPLTPARFDVLVEEPGRYEVHLTPAAGGGRSTVGTLVVVGKRR